MKKAWIVATALVLTALLLTGCDNGNVSGRNDGVVDGTNGTSVATLPTMGESQNPSQAQGKAPAPPETAVTLTKPEATALPARPETAAPPMERAPP